MRCVKAVHLLLLIFLLGSINAFAQPKNDDCSGAIVLPSGKNVCSGDAQYSTSGATSSFIGSGNDVWFAYTPRDAFDLFITIKGAGNGGSLIAPSIKLFTGCIESGGVELRGSVVSNNNITILNESSLTIGHTYYISVSGSNSGSFTVCTENQNSPVKAGQDCATARYLCSMESVRETDINGAGSVRDEGKGTCMDNQDGQSETYSAWYKWTAANNGSLVFTITPSVMTDDLDWALFDLGVAGNCNSKTVVACADGSGVTCAVPGNYYKTGLDFNSTDVRESAGCGNSEDGNLKDGKVKFVDMIKDHVYALLINNPYSQGNGFTLDFTDQNGKAGTGQFVGPGANINFTANTPCVRGQSFTFSTIPTAGTASIKWTFGDAGDASVINSAANGATTITYAKLGTKTAVLEAFGANGCSTIATKTFDVGIKPLIPVITASNTLCTGDTLTLSATSLADATYAWTGPNGYSGTGQTVSIPVNSTLQNGTYSVLITQYGCTSDPGTYTVSSIVDKPVAAFTTSPALPAKLSFPATVNFTDKSINADSWLWDFGDGSRTSTLQNPQHTYTARGDYTVSLTATNQRTCTASIMHGTFIVRPFNFLFIPNTFTPNGDGVNDDFVVTLTNMTNYHIRIYNRYGKQLYESASIFDNWDGRYNNEDLPVGTYYYLITATDATSLPVRRSGSVTLLR